MTTKLNQPVLGLVITEGGALTFTGVELLARIVDAARELQTSPVYVNGEGPILTSPDGTQYRLSVDNAGNLSTVAI